MRAIGSIPFIQSEWYPVRLQVRHGGSGAASNQGESSLLIPASMCFGIPYLRKTQDIRRERWLSGAELEVAATLPHERQTMPSVNWLPLVHER